MHRWSQRPLSRIIVVVSLVLSAIVPFIPTAAEAGFQQAYVRLDRMKASTATGGLVCAQPATAGTESKVIVTFPTVPAYTLNTTAANWTVSTANIPSAATAWPGIGTASAVDNSAKTATFPSSDLTVGTLYCFTFSGTNTLTTGTASASQQASVQTQTSGSVVIDLTQIALSNITDDQIVVSATVPPSFIFTLNGNADTFNTTLDPLSVVSTAGITATVTTNAKGGWIAWAKDSNQGLQSATAGYTIPTAGTVNGSPNTLTAGTEGYVLDTDLTTDASGGCTLAIDGEYNGATTAAGGTFSGNFQPVAACTGTSPATANGDVITLIERAAISGATPASSDYTDVITVVGAGNF